MKYKKEEKVIRVTLEKAKEWYKSTDSALRELALQAFTEKQLASSLPKTWEEFCQYNKLKKVECFIDFNSTIKSTPALGSLEVNRELDADKNVLPNEKSAKAHLALMQLEQLRDCYRDGWKPDWVYGELKYTICTVSDNIERHSTYHENKFLSFRTEDLRDKFLINFRRLIEEAKDLI